VKTGGLQRVQGSFDLQPTGNCSSLSRFDEGRQEDIPMIVASQAIYDEGKAAKAAQKADTDNPYPAGTQASLDWLEGYTADEEAQSSVQSALH
jgi:hypothetical protein